MARNYRCIEAGVAYHVTQRGTNGQAVFFENSDHATYLRFLRNHQKQCGVKILAYCLMPNHVHLVVRPEFEDSLGIFFQKVHGQFARFINLKEDRTGHLWTNRYFACPLSQKHLLRALHYVEHNPVRCGMVPSPEHFQWSSAAAHLGAPDSSQILDLEFWKAEGGANAWSELLATPEEVNQARSLRACTTTGRIFGSDSKPDEAPNFKQAAA